jgi:alpha-ketoglutaric semialdehyde dehydrogenase
LKPLLLLVDLQRDYLADPGLQPAAGEVTAGAASLLDGCRNAGIDVAHVWTTVSRDRDDRMPHWEREGRWLCEEGTPGHAPPPALEPLDGEPVVHKTHFDPFSGAALDDLLRERGTELLIVCGVHLHGCVREAVLGGYERGLEVWIAGDAVGSNDPVHAAITRRYLERRAARVISGSDALGALEADVRRPSPNGSVTTPAARCRAAQPAWSALPAGDRLAVLEHLAAALEDAAPDLAFQMADEIGKPIRFGEPEALRSAEMLRAISAHVRTPPVDEVSGATLHRRPLGTVAIITPWNNPIYIPIGKIAPALAYGNAVLWKPAPAAQALSERLASLLEGAGLPGGVLGLLPGGRPEAEAAMADPAVDAVSITGSSAAGYSAQEACARRRLPLQAELGGNNAALVWADADIGAAAGEIAAGAFAQAGQRCTANRRAIVHASRADEFLTALRESTAALRWGDARDPEVSVGPIVDARSRERIAAVVDRARDGAISIEVPHGASSPPGEREGAWYPPTIVQTGDTRAEIVQEESFGPVLVVQTAKDWDEAMSLMGDVPQGLAAAVFTSSQEQADRFEREARAGIVKVNRSTADAEVDVPFGGWKASGIGPPEHGAFDRDFYTRPQVVYR